MPFKTKLQIIDAKMEQPSGGTLTLSGNTTVADSGDMRYETHPTFVDDEQIVDKKYVDDNIVSGGTYSEDSPSTVTVGGLAAGTDLTGKTSNEILEEILVPYIAPTFTSFSIAGEPTTVEVGTQISGGKNFIWSTSQSGNVASNSIGIFDITGGANIATGLDNDGGQNVSIVTHTFTSQNETYQWRAFGTDTQAANFQSSAFTIRSFYPYYYGTVSAPGAAGANRPVANQALIDSGTAVIANAAGTITIPFNSSASDYIWFAVVTPNTKSTWEDANNPLNTGSIGGAVSPGGNLFPAPDSVSLSATTPNWGPINFNIYIANYQTAAGTIELS